MKQPNYLKYLNFKDTVANEPNVPGWAMEKARELAASRDTYSSMMLPWIITIARALVEARNEGETAQQGKINELVKVIEWCATWIDPKTPGYNRVRRALKEKQ